MKRFGNSVVVVTGGGGGIGKEIAADLWREDAKVCLVGRDRGRLMSAIPAAASGDDRVQVYPADITMDDDARDLARKLIVRNGRIDVLVHNAGIFAYGGWDSFSIEELDMLYRTNLRAPVLLTQELLPALKESKGQIVFINSSTVLSSKANIGAYALTKHGLRAFADSLRAEVNPLGVRVITIYPGRTATPMQETVCRLEGSEYRPDRLLHPSDVSKAVIDAILMPRAAETSEVFLRSM